MNIFNFLTEHIYLVTLALVSGGMLVWPLLRGGAGGDSVSTLQATQMINRDDALMLDVRDAAEHAKAHIINARNIPIAELDAKIGDLARHKAKGRPIIVHCESGTRSGAALTILRKQGFENVFSLAGGITAWRAAGLPLESNS